MGYLEKKTVYLAGPITAVSDDGIGWRKLITPKLRELGVIVDDPTVMTVGNLGEVADHKAMFKQLAKERKFAQLKEVFFPIVRKDLRCVDKADFFIFYYDPDVPMFGGIHELVVAHWQRKPILMFCEDDKVERINPWVLTFIKAGDLYTNWDELFKHLKDVDNHVFNTSYWTL